MFPSSLHAQTFVYSSCQTGIRVTCGLACEYLISALHSVLLSSSRFCMLITKHKMFMMQDNKDYRVTLTFSEESF